MLNCCFVNSIIAQTMDSQGIQVHKKEILFPPLTVLIDSALKHNAMVRYRNLEIDAKQANLQSNRKYWTRNFGLQADARYGNFNNNSYNVSEADATILTTSVTQINYGVGFYLKFPLFDVINRKTQIKQATAELDQARSLEEAQKDELRQLVIRQYQDAILKQKLLDIKSQNQGNARVNMEMVEKEFRNGVISITEYVRISDMTSKIQVAYEMAKSDFLLAKKLLENTVGFTLIKTYSNQKNENN